MTTTTTEIREPRLQRRIGVVRSDRRNKTIKVETGRLVPHAKYNKYLRRRTTLHAHDEKNEARAGDTVEIIQCRPISKTKSWRLLRVVRRSHGAAEGIPE